jgi:hypothetical protein
MEQNAVATDVPEGGALIGKTISVRVSQGQHTATGCRPAAGQRHEEITIGSDRHVTGSRKTLCHDHGAKACGKSQTTVVTRALLPGGGSGRNRQAQER